ncbi:MAG: hypothetical protein ABSA16_09280 [Thermoguttaceae bacterium]|jgi:hypothetical protein
MSAIKYQNRVVAFVDILGFKNMVNDPEKLKDVYDSFLIISGSRHSNWALEAAIADPAVDHFPNIPRGSAELSLFSDNFLISVPEDNSPAILALLINVTVLQNTLLSSRGILCRGTIHTGELIHGESPHKGNIIFGPAVTEAYQMEQGVSSYPRVILSDRFLSVLRRHNVFESYCNKHLIVRDSDGLYSLNYLILSFGIHCDTANSISELCFDGNPWSNDLIANQLTELNGKDWSDPRSYMNIKSKWMWLADRFNRQLERLRLTNPKTVELADLKPIELP